MKKYLLIGSAIIMALTSCESLLNNANDEYLFTTDDGMVYSYSDLELYDSSTHIFYLKSGHPEFKNNESSNFSLFAKGEEIYKGVFWPSYSSSMPSGPYISSFNSFYPDFTIRIEHMAVDNKPEDPRNDARIISALSDHNLLHSGLSVSFSSIDFEGGQLIFKFTVTNQDVSDLLIIDPDKTGLNLFHYFTNGLIIRQLTNEEVFSAHIIPEIPSPWNSWKTDWLSELKSGETRQFTINYSINSPLVPGEYIVSFEYPGLALGVTIDNLFQGDNRIWIGDISIFRKIIKVGE